MSYNEKLKILRERAELTQKETASIIKTSQSYYAQYENGKRQVPFDRIIELAKYYKISIDYIAELTDNINKQW